MSDPGFLTATRSNANGIRFLAPPGDASQSPEFIEFKKQYQQRYTAPMNDFLMRSTYDAAKAIINGVEAAGPSPSAVSQYLQSYETQGALGLVRFDVHGDIKDLHYVLNEVVDGRVSPLP